MPEQSPPLFTGLTDKFTAYLPDLFAGVLLVAIGWVLGWFVKRVIIQMAVILRLERFLVRLRGAEDFSKADVRYGLYNFLGNITFLIIFLIFLDDAMATWRLTVLSDFLKQGIFFFPKAATCLIIFGLGWLISSWAATALLKALRREDIPRPTLIARYAKAMLMLFFSAMSLAVLDIANVIVVIGFATIFITLGVLTIVLATLGGKDFINKMQEAFEEE